MKKLFTIVLVCALVFAGFSQEPGTVDAGFGDNGVSVINPCSNIDGWPYVLEQNDGKILLIGKTRQDGANYYISVSRLNADGTLDETYGTDNGYSFFRQQPVYLNEPFGAVLGKDGQLYILGHVFAEETINRGYILCVDENGMPNSTFGDGGYVLCDRNEMVFNDIAMDEDGNIYVAGWTSTGIYDNGVVQRYLPNGTLDTSYGSNGNILIMENETSSYVEALEIVEGNKLLVGGYDYAPNEAEMVYRQKGRLWKYNPDGSVDTSFGDNGEAKVESTNLSNLVIGMGMQSDGRYVVSGATELPKPVSNSNLPRQSVFVACVNQDGSIDMSFGSEGFVDYDLLQGDGCTTKLGEIVVAHDNQIFGSLYTYNYSTGEPNRAYAFNLNPDGTANEDFAGAGLMSLPWEGYLEVQALSVDMQRDGKLLVAGYCDINYASLDMKLLVSRINTSVAPMQDEEVGSPLVDITVDVLSGTSAKVTYVINEYTTEYFAGVLPKSQYEQYGEDFWVDYLFEYAMPSTASGEAVYDDLEEGTEYYAMAFGYNAKGERGEVTLESFSTVGCVELNDISFNVYPNPASTMIYVETEENNAQVSIVDIAGRCVKSVVLAEGLTAINIDDVEKGIYFVMIQQGNDKSVRKLVVR